MRMYVTGLPVDYKIEVERIGKLFFEEFTVVEDSVTADWTIDVQLHEEEQLAMQTTLTQQETEQVWTTSQTQEHADGQDEKQTKREIKRLLSTSLLQLLEQATGIIQPWGVLTGVRPTKLFHKQAEAGVGVDQIEQQLQQVHRVVPAKTALLREIVQQQHQAMPDLYHLADEVSIYIGIPFCPTKCAYCTFPAYAIQGRTGSVEAFLAGLHEEVEAMGQWLRQKGLRITTIYLGGGTPTSITAQQMDELFVHCEQAFPGFADVRELTVEAGRPDTLQPDKLAVLKKWNVDRISINPQSFEEETLKLIGRHHTVKETLEKFQLAREMGFDNMNMDLIIGLPGEGLETLRASLMQIEKLRPESLTVHTLSYKRGSHMSQNKQKYRVAGREEIAEMVKLARTFTHDLGYKPYYLYRQTNILGNQENVGYALPGKESLYNIIIMEEKQSIIALGCGAVSKMVAPGTGKITRWANPKEPNAYIESYPRHISGKIAALDEIYPYGVRIEKGVLDLKN